VDPAFTLDRLDEDRRGAVTDRILERGGIVPRHHHEARHERLERLLLLALRRGRQRAERASVEGVLEHDDLALRPVAAGELDRALVGLGAGVAEEHLAADRKRRQPLGQP
jgi:hypothetical protein